MTQEEKRILRQDIAIFDRTFKKIMTLSGRLVIGIINGLYETDYPADSTVTYSATEHVDSKLKQTFADGIITINGRFSYHIEAQMYTDGTLMFRMIEYGFQHALENSQTESPTRGILKFPRPLVVFLNLASAPEKYQLEIQFELGENYIYDIPVIPLLSMNAAQMQEKQLIGLLPFQLLRLRKLLTKDRSEKRIQELQTLVQDDILKIIHSSFQQGLINHEDYSSLLELTERLFKYLYAKYEEVELLTEKLDNVWKLDWEIAVEEGEKRGEKRGERAGREQARIEMQKRMQELGMSEEQIYVIMNGNQETLE